MPHAMFRCPATGLNVQTWLDERNPPLPNDTFESIVCPACTRLHFINVSGCKLLGSKDDATIRSFKALSAASGSGRRSRRARKISGQESVRVAAAESAIDLAL